MNASGSKVAPGFEGGIAWLNVDRPITIEELRGCVVIVDFWTYCCVNCMHVLPVLRTLEERYAAEPLVVIGVHSGKFSAERDPARIREAVGRYGVPHPVVVDDDMAIWSRFGIRSWPTLVVVGADGTVAAVAPGEPDLDTLDAFVRRELERARESGTLAGSRPDLHADPPNTHRPLRYPGKAAVLPDGRLCISDSGHHRVIVCGAGGRVEHCIGSGLRGWQDGSFEDAAFDDPQGSCWHDGALYVADARNHAVRKIDLERRVVSTVAGDGTLGSGAPAEAAPAIDTPLRSPWDLCSVGEHIYVAMAGNHQLWRLSPAKGTIEVFAGTGVEALVDGPVARSAWAQPSGLCEQSGVLYVADSETSAVRAVDLAAGTVRTLVGEGLFDFGDDEGAAGGPMLQHCLDVAAVAEGVLVADTYNGKIKLIELGQDGAARTLRTVVAGLGEPGSIDVEPDGAWVVADTNAHRVLRVRGEKLEALVIAGAPVPRVGALRPPSAPRPPVYSVEGWFRTQLELDPGQALGPGAARVVLRLSPPAGMKLAAGSAVTVSLEVSRRSDLLRVAKPTLLVPASGDACQTVELDVEVELGDERPVEAELLATLRFVSCATDSPQACHPGTMHLRLPLRLARGGMPELSFAVHLPGADA